MALVARLKPDTYRDSVELMRLSAEVAKRPGVRQFSAMMATPANLELLRAGGLLDPKLAEAGPNDLCLAAETEDEAAGEAALAAAEGLLTGGAGGSRAGAEDGGLPTTRSLHGALQARPDLNLALISVPGEYAAAEARRALRAGLHVMLFSDNVSLEEEIALKEEAERLGLLCMGPDCGTALIGGVPLGFANRVRRGRIGVVGASGTGLQAVTCRIHQLGEGISHALGSGGRDLSAAVGGRTTLAALETLAVDPATETLVVISKPGDAEVEAHVLARAATLGKPLVVHFLGRAEPPAELPEGVVWAGDLAETAAAAVALARSEADRAPLDHGWIEQEGREVAEAVGGGALAGLFTGGTLAAEAAQILAETLGRPPGRGQEPGEVARFGEHVIIDLGDDVFTRGRPHPIIDPAARLAVIDDRAIPDGWNILLLDVVLGYGAHPDPAGALAREVADYRRSAHNLGAGFEVLVSVVGTEQDPQSAREQAARLRAAGARVYETPTLAARVAAQTVKFLEGPSTA